MFDRPSPLEVAASWLPGVVEQRVEPCFDAPRAALEQVILRNADRRIMVAFSGGRDSSAVLALAVDVARRHGLPEPVPVTEVFAGDRDADERDWQEFVIGHLGLADWCRLRIDGDGDLLGPDAQASLRRFGVLWTPSVHLKSQLFATATSGVLLTGEGGDELLSATRNGPVRELVREHHWVGRHHGPALVEAAAPQLARRRLALRRLQATGEQPWLTESAARAHRRLLAADLASEPFSRARSIEWMARRRASIVAERTRVKVAAAYDARLVDPLLDPSVVSALARQAGLWGWRGRTTALRALVGDLLPEAILERRSKALFNTAYFGREARAFARTWDGSGLEPHLVHQEALRAEWLSPRPSALSFLPLHAAWLTTHAMASAA